MGRTPLEVAMPDPDGSVALSPEVDRFGLTPLMQRAVDGDRAALDALLGKLRPYLHALVRARLGPELDPMLDRSDLVQEGLFRTCRNIGDLRERTAPCLLAWVRKIMRHLVIDALGEKRPAGMPVIDPPIFDPTPAGQEIRDRQALRVATALQQLPERRRQVIELTFLKQLPDSEISRLLGGSEGAVRVLRFRA